ncbi:TonB C-terminal domain-containing protein [Deltaproteobacteria bacterium TL4]
MNSYVVTANQRQFSMIFTISFALHLLLLGIGFAGIVLKTPKPIKARIGIKIEQQQAPATPAATSASPVVSTPAAPPVVAAPVVASVPPVVPSKVSIRKTGKPEVLKKPLLNRPKPLPLVSAPLDIKVPHKNEVSLDSVPKNLPQISAPKDLTLRSPLFPKLQSPLSDKTILPLEFSPTNSLPKPVTGLPTDIPVPTLPLSQVESPPSEFSPTLPYKPPEVKPVNTVNAPIQSFREEIPMPEVTIEPSLVSTPPIQPLVEERVSPVEVDNSSLTQASDLSGSDTLIRNFRLKQAESQYQSQIVSQIQDKFIVPRGTEKKLYVSIELEIDVSGTIIRHLLIRKSGKEAFDLTAVNAVKNVKLPILPKELAQNPPYVITIILRSFASETSSKKGS